jgi:hypothetical protein
MGPAQPLVKDDDLATAVPPGTHLSDGDLRIGHQIGGAPLEEDQPGSGE